MLLKEYIEELFYCGRWRWEYDVLCMMRMVDDRSDELFEWMLMSLVLINWCMVCNEMMFLGFMVELLFVLFEEMLELVFVVLKEFVVI